MRALLLLFFFWISSLLWNVLLMVWFLICWGAQKTRCLWEEAGGSRASTHHKVRGCDPFCLIWWKKWSIWILKLKWLFFLEWRKWNSDFFIISFNVTDCSSWFAFRRFAAQIASTQKNRAEVDSFLWWNLMLCTDPLTNWKMKLRFLSGGGQFETGNQEVKLGEFKFEWIWRQHICRWRTQANYGWPASANVFRADRTNA